MTRQAAPKLYANFSGGLITEASVLSFPENAATDIDNFDLLENGSIARRAGLKYDTSVTVAFPPVDRALATTATNIFKWKAVNGKPSLNIGVVQIGDTLSFYYLKDDNVSSADLAADPITLSATIRSSASTSELRYSTDLQMVSGGGRLYVVGKYIDPFVLTFTEPTTLYNKGSVSQTTLNIKIRDFKVAEEGTANVGGYSVAGAARQDFMSGAHFYNLANQGWPSNVNSFGVFDSVVEEVTSKVSSTSNPGGGATDSEPATYTNTKIGFFPTTADQFHTYQAGGGTTITEQIAYSPWLLENDYTGNTIAPRGKFIKEAFYIRRRATGDIGSATPTTELNNLLSYDVTESSDTRPETVAFYAGRVWYAGLEGSAFTNNIYFSQVIGDDIEKASKCYQEADPTAEVINELVATDGGLLNLEEIGKIYRLEPIGPSLAVVADNGVWIISGDGEFSSFTATAFSIRKITDQGATSNKSIVFAKNSMFYWGETAIYVLALNPQGMLVAQDITSSTIKSFFQQTSIFTKKSVFSVFDEGANKILWFYSNIDDDDDSYDDFPNKAYNKVLYYDISLNAFGKYSLGITPSSMVVSAITADILTQVDIEDPVTQDGEQVTTNELEDVTTDIKFFLQDRSSIKLLTVTGNALAGWVYRFSDFTDIENFQDWGVSFSSYVETGFDSLQEIIGRAKKALLLQTHLTRTETGFKESGDELIFKNPSSCLVSYNWDWGSEYANQFQAYRYLKNYTPADKDDPLTYNRDVISTRNRIRGRGTALGLRIESEAGKDLKLLGYGILYTTRNRP